MKPRSLILAALALTTGAVAFANVPAGTTTASPLTEIQQALLVNSEAQSQEEWLQSGFTPAEIFARMRADHSKKARYNICRELVALSASDLALFEEEISNPENALPCAAALNQKLAAHWEKANVAFNMNRMEENVSRALREGEEPAPPATLPSVERHLDVIAEPYLVRGELKPGEINFTFDDGPHGSRTAKVLKILSDYGVRANFFEIGQNAHEMPQISKQVADAGHMVGSHSWSHPLNMTRLSMEAAEKEFDKGRAAVSDATGVDIPFFRFPGGNKNQALMNMVKSKGFAAFYWTMDTRDWQIRDPDALYKNVLKEIDREKGGIILFHDVHPQTVIVLPQVMEELRARNYTTYLFVPH